ncbi:hypothetical protein SAMN05444673_2131 [Bacillus sp. OV166]|nr:hypothetical protein SAMN05444673_2131 [Bacillus sp. OV166]
MKEFFTDMVTKLQIIDILRNFLLYFYSMSYSKNVSKPTLITVGFIQKVILESIRIQSL